jgi:hypothetical protein
LADRAALSLPRLTGGNLHTVVRGEPRRRLERPRHRTAGQQPADPTAGAVHRPSAAAVATDRRTVACAFDGYLPSVTHTISLAGGHCSVHIAAATLRPPFALGRGIRISAASICSVKNSWRISFHHVRIFNRLSRRLIESSAIQCG